MWVVLVHVRLCDEINVRRRNGCIIDFVQNGDGLTVLPIIWMGSDSGRNLQIVKRGLLLAEIAIERIHVILLAKASSFI